MSLATVVMLASRDASGMYVEHRFADDNVMHSFDDGLDLDPVFVEDRVINAALMRRDMYGPGRTMGGAVSISSGVVTLINDGEGSLDYCGTTHSTASSSPSRLPAPFTEPATSSSQPSTTRR